MKPRSWTDSFMCVEGYHRYQGHLPHKDVRGRMAFTAKWEKILPAALESFQSVRGEPRL